MILYEKLINSEYHKNITIEFINREYPEIADTLYNNICDIVNQLNNSFSSQTLSLKMCAKNDKVLKNVLERLCIKVDYKQIAGNVLETIMVEYIKDKFSNNNIVKWPNGEMNFPDFSFNNIAIDVKSVFVPEESDVIHKYDKHGNKNYTNFNNSIESVTSVTNQLKDYFSKSYNCDNIAKSFILFVYYSVTSDGIKILATQIVPLIITIKTKKNENIFAIKSKSNANVTIGLTTNDKRTLDEIYNRLKLIINT